MQRVEDLGRNGDIAHPQQRGGHEALDWVCMDHADGVRGHGIRQRKLLPPEAVIAFYWPSRI